MTGGWDAGGRDAVDAQDIQGVKLIEFPESLDAQNQECRSEPCRMVYVGWSTEYISARCGLGTKQEAFRQAVASSEFGHLSSWRLDQLHSVTHFPLLALLGPDWRAGRTVNGIY
jgi:hypothetical protein